MSSSLFFVDCVTPPEEGVACQPMTGSMTIYYERARLNSETLEQLKQGALDAISAGMTTNVYAKGIVKRLAYIGDTREGVTPAPVVVSEEQKAVNSNSKGDDSILGTTEITLVSSAAFLFILIAVAGFFIIPKRRKKEALRNGSVPHGAVLDDGFDNADETTEANAVKGWYNTKIEPVPIDRQQSSYSIEGSEIPGSLAATDALALKPQFPSRAFSGRASKKTPPAKEYRYRDNISVSAALEGLETIETDVPSYKSIVRLSPIHNQNSGISPSQVSPKRSSPLNAEAILSSGYKNDDSTEESSQYSDVDQMIAEIESEIPLSKIKSPRKGGSAIETLNRIVASDSVSDTSFRDSESGTSPFHRQAAPKMRSSLDIYQ